MLIAITSCGGTVETGDYGTITFSYGAGARSAGVFPPTDAIRAQISHTVELRGATVIKAATAPGVLNISVKAPAGQYDVTVTAWLNNEIYATGSATAVIQAGKTVPVVITMHAQEPGPGTGPGPAPQMKWNLVTETYTDSINSIAWGNNTFVAGGYSDAMVKSIDGGLAWNPVTMPTGISFGNIYSIAFGNGRFVAGGSNGTISYTTDNGANWTAASSNPFLSFLYPVDAIAYGDGRFVAVSTSGLIAWSDDNGENWTQATTNPFTALATPIPIYAIAYGNNKFVAGGDSGTIAWSADGSGWQTTTPPFGTDPITAIAYGNNTFVAGSDNGAIAWSTDGSSWNAVESPLDTNPITAIAYGGGKFIAGSSPKGKMAYSTDGKEWTLINSPFSIYGEDEAVKAIAWGNNRFVAGDNNGNIAWSTGKLE